MCVCVCVCVRACVCACVRACVCVRVQGTKIQRDNGEGHPLQRQDVDGGAVFQVHGKRLAKRRKKLRAGSRDGDLMSPLSVVPDVAARGGLTSPRVDLEHRAMKLEICYREERETERRFHVFSVLYLAL